MATTPAATASIIIRMAKLAAMGAEAEPPDIDDLAVYVEAQSAIAQFSDTDHSLELDDRYPGYLWRDGPRGRIYVPFNLASVFPGRTDLEAVVSVAEKVLLAEGDPLCISGSTTFLGQLASVGDLDFCEYYLLDPATLLKTLSPKTEASDPPLIWIKCGEEFKAPWEGLEGALAANFNEARTARLKLDFFTDSAFGPMPTTSVVLVTTTGEDGAAGHSFAYQEAVVLGDAPLRVVVSPQRLGAYTHWLRDEVRKLVEGRHEHQSEQAPVKALKRCLSLMLLLGRFDEAQTILEELSGSVLDEVVFAVRLNELRRMAEDCPQRRQILAARLDEIDATFQPPSLNAQRGALASANAVARSMLMEIDAWFEGVE